MLPKLFTGLSWALHRGCQADIRLHGERIALGTSAAVFAMLDTHRGDLVAVVSETTGYAQLKQLKERMQLTDEGIKVLTNRPRITSHTLERVSKLPPHTFGGAYASFMNSNGYKPESRVEVSVLPRFYLEEDVEEVCYTLQRYREAHDLWHVLVGIPPTVLGEIGQKWFEMLQTGLPMTTLGSLVGPLRLSMREKRLLAQHYIPWAIECNSKCDFLMSKMLEEHFERDLDEVRKEFGIVQAPRV